MKVPDEIRLAVSALLKPYGVDFTQLVNCSENPNTSQRYMTAKQASIYCGLQPKTLRDKALAGEIASIRLGNSDKSRVLIDKQALDHWLAGFASRNKQTV
jgi:hypothetical protein